jgi:RNA polymerase sigma-70 factor (ECF subfamily)
METQGIALPMTSYRPAQPDESLELWRRAQSGDLAAFARIMETCQHRVLRIALRLLNNPQDAQDAAQEVFLRLYKNLKRLDNLRSGEPWLYRVTINVCRDIGRSRARSVALDDIPEPMHAGSNSHDDAERAQQRRIVHRAIERLSEKERAALVLRDVEGLSTRDVAAILGSSEGTVRSQICSARLKLREFTRRLMRRSV